MFDLGTTIAEALRVRPELRELLPAFHPAFSKLQHPLLGRVLPRLVTVADAARIAGVDAEALLTVMNLPGAPLDLHPAAPPVGDETPPPPWADAARETLDVRPVLAAGQEPFAQIMSALRRLAPGQGLLLLAPFEPAPLIRLLSGQGWLSHVGWDRAEDPPVCRVHLLFPEGAGSDTAPGARLDQHLRAEGDGYTLDVRALAPPDPLRLALEAVDAGRLPLRMLHRRVPALLLPKLAERGLVSELTEAGDEVQLRIHRP